MRDSVKVAKGVWLGVLLAVTPAFSMEPPSLRELAEKGIREDLRMRKGSHFGDLPLQWKKKFGVEGVIVLTALARNPNLDEMDRYVALMGAVQLGGYGMASVFYDLLEDPSWVLRAGELRALKATGKEDAGITPAIRKKILDRLQDPALVVRSEAVETVAELKIPGAISALMAVLRDPRNVSGGEVLWVSRRALRALSELGGSRCRGCGSIEKWVTKK